MNKKLPYIIGSYLLYIMVSSCNDQGRVCDTGNDFIYVGGTTQNVVQRKSDIGTHNISRIDKTSVKIQTDERFGFTLEFVDSTTNIYSLCGLNNWNMHTQKANATTDFFLNQYICVDTFVSIEIISVNDFDSAHNANSNVNEYFTFTDKNALSVVDGDLESLVTFLNTEVRGFSYDSPKYVQLLFLLEKESEVDQEVSFTITCTFTSGRSISTTTKPVTFMY